MNDQAGRFPAATTAGLQVAGLRCRRGERLLFGSLAVQLAPGAALHVAGGNGVGKTTLLRVLAGLARPEDGAVLWNGAPLHGADQPVQVAYLGHANALKDDFSALENLRYGSPAAPDVGADAALASLEWIGLAAQAQLPVRVLSQGQRRRVALARLRLAHARPLWLADEPFAALDRATVARVCALFEEQRARGGIVIYTTHDEQRLAGTLTLDLDLDVAAEAAC